MKKTIFILVLLLTNFLATAQNTELLKDDQFKKLVDDITCICVNDALKTPTIDCENSTITANDINPSQTTTKALLLEFQKLKSTDVTSEKNIVFLTNNVFNSQKYKRIKSFADKRNGAEIDEIKRKINEKAENLNKEVSEGNYEGTQTSDQISVVPQNSSQEYTENISETKSPKSGFLYFMTNYGFSLILFVFVLAQFLYTHKKNTDLKDIINGLKSEIKRLENNVNQNPNQPREKLVSKDFNELDKKINVMISELKDRINNLEQNNKVIASVPSVEPFEGTSGVAKAATEKQVEKVFYKHAPLDNGNFDADDNVNLKDAVFKFTINKSNPNQASFELIKEQKNLFLNYPNKYIKPVCEELNLLNQKALNVEITPGKVEKKNNQWVVLTKAKIKYK